MTYYKKFIQYLVLLMLPISIHAQIHTDPATGNVGIGTTVVENVEGWNKVLEVKGVGSTKSVTSTQSVFTGIWSHDYGFYNAPAGGITGTYSNHPFTIMTNKLGRLFIATNGNVGIGTGSPQTKLEVAGDSYTNGWAGAKGFDIREAGDNVLKSQQGGQVHHLIGTYAGWDPKGVYIAGYNGSISSYGITENVYIGNPSNNNKFLAVNLMNGGVGIGTTNTNDPNFRLFVEGGIRTRKVKVDVASWPDYVFSSSYQLPSLMEVEIFIQKNSHLPGVPAAAEVEKNGLDIGDSHAVLLKKIEELTLYIIDLKKENKRLDERLNSLETNNNRLK